MSDSKKEPDIAADNDGTTITSTLVDPFEVGDCQMNAGATVTLHLDDPDSGSSTLTWDADVLTRQTHFGDKWHQSFDFKTNHGKIIVSAEVDGPDMNDENQTKHAHAEKTLTVDPDLFAAIHKVDWTGEC